MPVVDDKQMSTVAQSDLTGWRLPKKVALAQRVRTTLAAQRHDPDNADHYRELLQQQAARLNPLAAADDSDPA